MVTVVELIVTRTGLTFEVKACTWRSTRVGEERRRRIVVVVVVVEVAVVVVVLVVVVLTR